jgi:hypothetical protein
VPDVDAADGRPRPLVVTVHGINTDGEWQRIVQELLTPHCDFLHYHYGGYRYAGFLRQYLSPTLCFAIIALLSFWLSGALAISPAPAANPPSQAQQRLGIPWPWDTWLAIGLAVLAAWWLANALRPRRITTWLPEWSLPWLRSLLAWIAACFGLIMGPWRQFAFGGLALPVAGLLLVTVAEADRDPWLKLTGWLGRAIAYVKAQAAPLGFALIAVSLGLAIASTGLLSAQQLTSAVWMGVLAILAIMSLAAAYGFAILQRARQADDFLRYLNTNLAAANHRPVHLIAHSFGTFLTGEALRRPAKLTPEFDRIIMVGSVLPRDFQWHSEGDARKLREKVNQVRNEVGGRDAVVSVIRWFEKWNWGWLRFGYAGIVGYDRVADSDLVHNIENSLDFCEECVIHEQVRKRRVHNVFLPTFRHSDAFAVRERTSRLWLPYLLGLDAWEYWNFRYMCAKAATYETTMGDVQHEFDALGGEISRSLGDLAVASGPTYSQGDRDTIQSQIDKLVQQRNAVAKKLAQAQRSLARMETQLAQSHWSWATMGGINVTLNDWVVRHLIDRFVVTGMALPQAATESRARSQRAIRTMWGLVGRAVEITRGQMATGQAVIPPAEAALLLTLDPRIAVREAIVKIG